MRKVIYEYNGSNAVHGYKPKVRPVVTKYVLPPPPAVSDEMIAKLHNLMEQEIQKAFYCVSGKYAKPNELPGKPLQFFTPYRGP